MKFLKKKAIIIPLIIILLLVIVGILPKVAGTIMIIGAAGGGIYLYTKNDKFKNYGKGTKTIITIGLIFTLIFGIGILEYDPQAVEQQRLAGEKIKAEQQKSEELNKAEQAKKVEAAKQLEEVKKKTEAEEKLKTLAKFNLKEVIVSRIIDGDTVELSDGNKVALIGINIPQSTTKNEPYGKEASDYIKNQLTGKTVYIEKDTSEADKSGRLLRYVWLEIPKELSDSEIRTKMFNSILVSQGYAQVSSTYLSDVKYEEYFTKYNAEAKNSNKGLWAINKAASVDTSASNVAANNSSKSFSGSSAKVKAANSTPEENSSNQSAGKVIITVTGKKYHNSGCRTIKQVKSTVTKEEAQSMGYGPCGVCHT